MSPRNRSVPPVSVPPTDHGRRAWIKYQLSLRGYSLASLAQKHGFSRKTIQKALDHSYPHMEDLIAQALQVRPQMIWPERFAARGDRLRKQRLRRKTRSAASGLSRVARGRHQ